jgi:membrane fusion protein (multidrug efflux system)
MSPQKPMPLDPGYLRNRKRDSLIVIWAGPLANPLSARWRASAPVDVEVARVAARDVPIVKEWVGTLDGRVNAEIRGQVTGYLLRQAYREGSFVRQGDLLFEIDPRPFQAALNEAKGRLAAMIVDRWIQ